MNNGFPSLIFWSGLVAAIGLYNAAQPSAPHVVTHKLSMPKLVPTELDQKLVNAVIYIESRGHANAVSNKGAVGIMQVEPATAALYGVSRKQLFTPTTNRLVGSAYLRDMIEAKGSVRGGLIAYNCGPNQDLPECHDYADSVLGVYANEQ